MDVLNGFFSTQGRSSRVRLLAFLAATLAIAWIAILRMRDGSVLVVTLSGALVGLATGKLAIEAARRRHDIGKRATPALVLLALAALAAFALAFHGIAAGPRLLSYAALLLFLALAAFLLLGTAKVGSTDRPARTTARETGPMVALVLTALGGALAFTGYCWTQGAAQQRAREEAFVQQREHHQNRDSGINDLEATYAKEHPQ